jgi:hypothetical protein
VNFGVHLNVWEIYEPPSTVLYEAKAKSYRVPGKVLDKISPVLAAWPFSSLRAFVLIVVCSRRLWTNIFF